jgi:predicted AAA+ superfamily ATPase
MNWYQRLGYKKNPLETDLLKVTPELTVFQKQIEELIYRVYAGNIVLIEGPVSSGKTLILKHVINHFKGENKSIYIDAKKTSKRLDIEIVLKKSQSWTQRILGKLPQKKILFLDNAEFLTKKNQERIKYFYDQNYLQSVIFAVYDSSNLTNSLKDRIGKRIFKLSRPTFEEAVTITIARLGDDILTRSLVQKIFVLSNKNLTKHLLNCEKVLNHLIIQNRENISNEELEELLGGSK